MDDLTPRNGDFCAYIDALQAQKLLKLQSLIRQDHQELAAKLNEGRRKSSFFARKAIDRMEAIDQSLSGAENPSLTAAKKPRFTAGKNTAGLKKGSTKGSAASGSRTAFGSIGKKIAGSLILIIAVFGTAVLSFLSETGDLSSAIMTIAAVLIFLGFGFASSLLSKRRR